MAHSFNMKPLLYFSLFSFVDICFDCMSLFCRFIFHNSLLSLPLQPSRTSASWCVFINTSFIFWLTFFLYAQTIARLVGRLDLLTLLSLAFVGGRTAFQIARTFMSCIQRTRQQPDRTSFSFLAYLCTSLLCASVVFFCLGIFSSWDWELKLESAVPLEKGICALRFQYLRSCEVEVEVASGYSRNHYN